MADKTFDPTKPSFYLDNSTLCAIGKALRAGQDAPKYAAYLPLRAWVERVAREANLSLSFAHLLELEGWEDQVTARSTVEWYERLPVVWTYSRFDKADHFEALIWTARAAGVPSHAVTKPFATSYLDSFWSMTPGLAARLRASTTPLLDTFDAKLDLEPYKERFMREAEGFREDRAWVGKQSWTKEQTADRLVSKERDELRRLSTTADCLLRRDPTYASRACMGCEIPGRFLALFDREPSAMPLFRTDRRFFAGLSERVVRGQPGSKRLRDDLKGSFCDWIHLVGAAYCDVFTCDGTVSSWLADLRGTLGLRAQLIVRNHPGSTEGFVHDLMATFP